MPPGTDQSSFPGLRAWIIAVALAAALPYALKTAADNDLWWHVRTGQIILAQRALPEADSFSFTAAGAPWTNHEWLADVVVATIYGIGGDRALSLWRTGLLVAVLALLTALLWRRIPHPLFVLGGVLLATPLVRVLINLRPHSFTYLFALLLILMLELSPRRPRLLWCVPPLIVLWTNLHGGFVLGLGILTIVLGARLLRLDGETTAPDRLELRTIVGAYALSILAPLANPYGPGLFLYLFRELGADHSLILEWQGIWAYPGLRVHFLVLCILPALLQLAARSIRPAGQVTLLFVGALATWVHARFLILLVFFAFLVGFSALSLLLNRLPRVRRGGLLRRLTAPRWAWTLCGLPLLAAVLQFSVDLAQRGLRLHKPFHLPVEACEFLRAHELGPNLLLRLDWGGYAIWHLYPDYKVSADGRNLTVYDARFVDGLLRSYHEGRFTELTHEHDVDVILSEAAGPTYAELRAHRGWVRVHEDRVAAVFVRPEVARTLADRVIQPAEILPAADRRFFP